MMLTAFSSVVGAILQMSAFSIVQLMIGRIIAGNVISHPLFINNAE
jgi:hypothetical protein